MAVPRITKEDLKQQLDAPDAAARPVLLDVRLKYPYEHSTVKLPGALRVAPESPDLSAVPTDRAVVAYDSDPDELVSVRIVARLIRQGYAARALKGGISEWMAANFPTETKAAPKQSAPAPGSLKG
jgi:rhodanese-related sulfurtransferase